MPFYFAHSVTDLICRKNKEILVLVYSIPPIYKIQTFNNVNRQTLREKKTKSYECDKNSPSVDWGQKASECNTTKIVERFPD